MPTEPTLVLACCYLSLNALATFPTNVNQDPVEARNAVSPGALIAAGYHPRPWLRTELELGWRQWQIHGYGDESADGDTNLVTALANAWFSTPGDRWYSLLYIGGGVGAGFEDVDGSSSASGRKRSGTERVGASHLGAGLRVPLVSTQLTLDLGYRRLFTTGHTEQHTILLGFSHQFGTAE